MIHIANIVGLKNKSVALVTGDSVGQVASQTLSNIRAISDVSTLPILRPLAGMNKENIVNRAKEIKTYEISILPYEDCCSFFVPQHPETKAKIEQIDRLDSKLDLADLVNKAVKDTEKINMNFGDSL
jgi:thiamine biosynthesis protein ThiI